MRVDLSKGRLFLLSNASVSLKAYLTESNPTRAPQLYVANPEVLKMRYIIDPRYGLRASLCDKSRLNFATP